MGGREVENEGGSADYSSASFLTLSGRLNGGL